MPNEGSIADATQESAQATRLANIAGPIIGADRALQAVEVPECLAIESHTALQQFRPTSGIRIALALSSDLNGYEGVPYAYGLEASNDTPTAYAASFSGYQDAIGPITILCCAAGPDTLFQWEVLTHGWSNVAHIHPRQAIANYKTLARARLMDMRIDIINFIVYSFKEDDAYGFISDHRIKPIQKVVSAIYSMFPWTQTPIAEKFTVVTYHLPTAYVDPADVTQAERNICALAIMLYGASYSVSSTVITQIYNRLKATLASSMYPMPSPDQMRTAYEAAGWETSLNVGYVNWALGYAICINSTFQFDIEVSAADMATKEQLTTEYGLSDLAWRLNDQMRTIFTGFQSTTLKIALSFLRIYRSWLIALGNVWEKEATDLALVEDRILNRAYIGCVEVIPEGRRVVTFPRCCYIALLYYKRTLNTDHAKDEWTKYNVVGVIAHINNPSDEATCGIIAGLLPDPSILTVAALAAHLSFDQIESIALLRDPILKEALFFTLHQSKSKAAWYKTTLANKEATHTAEIKTKLDGVVKTMLQEKVSRERNKVTMIQNPVERAQQALLLSEWEESVAGKISSQTKLDQYIAFDTPGYLLEARQRLLAEYEAMVLSIRNYQRVVEQPVEGSDEEGGD